MHPQTPLQRDRNPGGRQGEASGLTAGLDGVSQGWNLDPHRKVTQWRSDGARRRGCFALLGSLGLWLLRAVFALTQIICRAAVLLRASGHMTSTAFQGFWGGGVVFSGRWIGPDEPDVGKSRHLQHRSHNQP